MSDNMNLQQMGAKKTSNAVGNDLQRSAARPVRPSSAQASAALNPLNQAASKVRNVQQERFVSDSWRRRQDGSAKTFDELTTPEVMTWISTLPQEQQQSAAAQFESEYLKNPASKRYDPYYTQYSNNDSARQLFGVDTFDQTWIDANRGYASYLTFTNESYTTPKKPGKNASAQEQAAYQWWLIANTYEETTQAAESEYAQLRADMQESIRSMRAAGKRLSADELMASIDWSDYRTLSNLREASAAGNGRMLNRPVQVGDESIRSMISAALRGEDITDARDWVMGESQYMQSRPRTTRAAMDEGIRRWLEKQTDSGTKSDVTSVDYDPYAGQGSNNQAARALFGVDTFDQAWIDANRSLMANITFAEEDDQKPVKPGKNATPEEKKAYEYWLIAHTYEQTTREGEKELAALEEAMRRKAAILGAEATAEKLVAAINWDDYPTLRNMRDTAAAGNARMVNRPVHTGDDSLLEMARRITGERTPETAEDSGAAMSEDQTESGANSTTTPNSERTQTAAESMVSLTQAQIEALEEMAAQQPEGSPGRREAEAKAERLRAQMQAVSPENAAQGNRQAGLGAWLFRAITGNDLPEERPKYYPASHSAAVRQAQTSLGLPTVSEPKVSDEERHEAAVQAVAEEQSRKESAENLADWYQERIQARADEVYGKVAPASAPQYNETVGSIRATFGLNSAIAYVKGQIASLDIERRMGDGSVESGLDVAEATWLQKQFMEQMELLEQEQAQRAEIAARVRAATDAEGWSSSGILRYLWNQDYQDALRDADHVPIEDYERYLIYRCTPPQPDGRGGEVYAYPEMAQYDQMGDWQARAGLITAGVGEGIQKMNFIMPAVEEVTYWLKSHSQQYDGWTREEIYAVDRDLADLRAWNASFEHEIIDPEQKRELTEDYPVITQISEAISEIIKMQAQSYVGGQIGEAMGNIGKALAPASNAGEALLPAAGSAMQSVVKMLGKAGEYLPFALDSFTSGVQTARSEGATDDQAMLAGTLNGMISGPLSGAAAEALGKIGSGIARPLADKILGSPAAKKLLAEGAAKAVQNGWVPAVLSLIRGGIGEGVEEALEEGIQSGINKAVYDRDRAWFGEGGVVDPEAMLQAGIGGAVVGIGYPLVSAAGSVSAARSAQKDAERGSKQKSNAVQKAIQRTGVVLRGLGKDMSAAIKTTAERIMQRLTDGENVTDEEIAELEQMEQRELITQERATEIVRQSQGDIDAARQEAEAAQETAQSAAQKLAEAQATTQSAVQEARPIINALNDGTANYADPETAEKLAEAHSRAMHAKEAERQAAQEAETAQRAADEAQQRAQQTEAQIHAQARAQAQGEAAAEMQQAQTEADNRQEEARKAQYVPPEGKLRPGVQHKYTRKIDARAQTQLNILDSLGRAYGVEFDVVDTLGSGVNAMYNPAKRGVIMVSLDAFEGAYVQAGTHELVHYVRSQSEEGYTLLQETVREAMRRNGTTDAELEYMINEHIKQYREVSGQEMSEEAALEEIIAEAVPTIFSNADALDYMIRKDRTLVEKIRDFFRDFAQKLRDIAERYMYGADRLEMASIINDADAMMDIAYALDDALEAAGERAAEGVEGQTRFSVSGNLETHEMREAMREQYADLRKRLRSEGVSLTDVQKQAVEASHDSYTEWRRGMMGMVKVTDKSSTLEALWGELSAQYPEIFPAETAEGDMPAVLERFIDQVRPMRAQSIAETDGDVSIAGDILKKYRIGLDRGETNAAIDEMIELYREQTAQSDQRAEELAAELAGKIARSSRKKTEGLDAGVTAAAIALDIKSAALQRIGRDEDSVSASMAAEELRAKGRARVVQEQEARRAKRMATVKEIAGKIREARDAGDDEALREALAAYRTEMRQRIDVMGKTGVLEIGLQIRDSKTLLRRLTQQIAAEKDLIEGEDADIDAEQARERIASLERLREQEQEKLQALHRQQVIARDKNRIKATDERIEDTEGMIDEAINGAMNRDMAEAINDMRDDVKNRVKQLLERMRKKMRDYSRISTIGADDCAAVFDDLMPELTQSSELAVTWQESEQRSRGMLEQMRAQMETYQDRLQEAVQSADQTAANELKDLMRETQDRIDVLKSQVRRAQDNARYYRRMGAETMQQALREGRLPQPIMERVIAMCADAGRDPSRFNSNIFVQHGLESGRLSLTTAARVWDDLFGEAAPLIRAIYYDPVMDNETARQNWMRQWRERIKALKLSKEESRIVQLIGEGKASDTEINNASDTVREAVKVFRAFYAEAYEMANGALTRNGYPKLGHIRDYFPHIRKPDTIWQKLGIPIEEELLPTSINGLTDTFTPGRTKKSVHELRREGDRTDFDAIFGFEEYLEPMSNVIFHTDDIQRHRQLESEIRAAAKNGMFEGGAGSTHLSQFVRWIHEYTNQLAGKRAKIDRSIEDFVDRPLYRAAMGLKNIKGASAVSGNIGSAITNIIPVQQVISEHPKAAVLAAYQTLLRNVTGQGNVPQSQYLIRRFGSDAINPSVYTKITKGAGVVFDQIDQFASNLVVNTYYQANLAMGMDSETAMRSADAKAARLMGDRSKGAMPTAYGSQVLSLFTQFQYEVANQSQRFRKDIWRGNSRPRAFGILFGTIISGWLLNFVTENLIGRRIAADPIDMALDIYQTWRQDGEPLPIAQAMYSNVSEIFPYLSGGGRIAAFEGFGSLLTELISGNEGSIAHALSEALWSAVPMGGQIKKTSQGVQAWIRGGVYNTKGDQLRYPVEGFLPVVQAAIFGPGSTEAGRAYYEGDAPGLSKAQTAAYEQHRARGAGPEEAYRNEADKAAAAKLDEEADKAEHAQADAEARRRAGLDAADADTSQVESQRAEAAELRSEAIPGDALSDYWWSKRDEPSVQAGIDLWRATGETWALPHGYSAETKLTVDGRTEYLGERMADAVNQMYEDGYREIMYGVDADKLDEEALSELKKQLETLKRKTDAYIREEIKSIRGGR